MSGSDLTLPGDIPGLLRRGSPVVVVVGLGVGWGGVVDNVRNGFATAAYAESEKRCISDTKSLALDLTDATGRAHAAWWVRAQDADAMLHGVCVFWSVPVWSELDRLAFWDSISEAYCRSWAEALAHLDPDDPRTLPDGSRVVDAEALKLVVLHVAGRS